MLARAARIVAETICLAAGTSLLCALAAIDRRRKRLAGTNLGVN